MMGLSRRRPCRGVGALVYFLAGMAVVSVVKVGSSSTLPKNGGSEEPGGFRPASLTIVADSDTSTEDSGSSSTIPPADQGFEDPLHGEKGNRESHTRVVLVDETTSHSSSTGAGSAKYELTHGSYGDGATGENTTDVVSTEAAPLGAPTSGGAVAFHTSMDNAAEIEASGHSNTRNPLTNETDRSASTRGTEATLPNTDVPARRTLFSPLACCAACVSVGLVSDAAASPCCRNPPPSRGRQSLVSRCRSRLQRFLQSRGQGRARQPSTQRLKRYILLLMSWLDAALTSGCLYGWQGLSNLIARQHAFASLCTLASEMPCAEQSAAIASLFSVGCVLNCMMCAVAGGVYRRIGPQGSAVLGHLMNVFGWTLLGTSSPSFQAYTAAIAFIGAAGNFRILPFLTVRHLFPRHQDLIIMLFGAAFTISTIVPSLIVQVATVPALGAGSAIMLYVMLVLLPATATLFVLPSEDFDTSDNDEQRLDQPNTRALNRKGSNEELHQRHVPRRIVRWYRQLATACCLDRVLTAPFALATWYRAVCNIGAAFFHQSAPSVLPSSVRNALDYVLPLGCVACVAMGVASSRIPRIALMSAVTLAGVLMYALPLFVGNSTTFYISIVLMSLFVACFSSQHFSLIETLFGTRDFAVLAGWSVMLSGVLGTASSFLYEDVALRWLHGNTVPVRVGIAIAFCLQFLWILLLHRHIQQQNSTVSTGVQNLPLDHVAPVNESTTEDTDRTQGEDDGV